LLHCVVQANGDVITKVLLSGDREVFRLQAVMDASLEELYDILSVRVEEAHRWNNSFNTSR
jgi:hypothetical protein